VLGVQQQQQVQQQAQEQEQEQQEEQEEEQGQELEREQSKEQQGQQGQQGQTQQGMDGGEGKQVDFIKYPPLLDSLFETLDPHSSLRPTIITPSHSWVKSAQKALLGGISTSSMGGAEQLKEKEAAFDLLDALTRSGALPLEDASLHVIIASTHVFDQSLLDTVVCRNVNPIERVERSTLIMASALHGVHGMNGVHGVGGLGVRDMLAVGQVDRVQTYSPMLFDA
jgi:hypothetical protein